jgi:hypothetical protein
MVELDALLLAGLAALCGAILVLARTARHLPPWQPRPVRVEHAREGRRIE